LRRTEAGQKPASPTLSRLAQLSRADALVILIVADGRARIWFFDAERGGLSNETIESAIDPTTGRVVALAERAARAQPQRAEPKAAAGGSTQAPKSEEPGATPPTTSKVAKT